VIKHSKTPLEKHVWQEASCDKMQYTWLEVSLSENVTALGDRKSIMIYTKTCSRNPETAVTWGKVGGSNKNQK